MAAAIAQIAAVGGGMAILAAMHLDIWSRSPLKSVALAAGIGVAGALLIAASRTLS